MPVKINMPTADYHAATDSRFDACVRLLAPLIRKLREKPGQRSTRKLTDRLNAMGQVGPNGKKLGFSTMRRILLRLPELHLGDGPSDRSRAASDRKTPYCFRPGKHSSAQGVNRALADAGNANS
jgi:hypothetical protein